jgi:heme A synthase
MKSFRIVGALISVICLVLAGLFIWGLVAGDEWRFWAIAAPVIVGFSAVLGIGFSIGRLMSSTQFSEPPENPPKD